MTIYYEIRIAGLVPPGALHGFAEMAAEQRTETVVRGPLPDQAALHGLLARLESSRVQLVRLRRHEHPPRAWHVSATSPGQLAGTADPGVRYE
jgi:hypothetical protein